MCASLLRDAGGAGAGAAGAAGTAPLFISDAMYRLWYGDARNSAAQSRPGCVSKAWNTSAQSDLPKYRRPSAGGPKNATLPPGTRTSNRSHRLRLATLWVTTITVRP